MWLGRQHEEKRRKSHGFQWCISTLLSGASIIRSESDEEEDRRQWAAVGRPVGRAERGRTPTRPTHLLLVLSGLSCLGETQLLSWLFNKSCGEIISGPPAWMLTWFGEVNLWNNEMSSTCAFYSFIICECCKYEKKCKEDSLKKPVCKVWIQI